MAPNSRKRPTGGRAKSKRRHKALQPIRLVSGNKVEINKAKILELRDNRDFIASIRTGRALNALLTFAVDTNRLHMGKQEGKRCPC